VSLGVWKRAWRRRRCAERGRRAIGEGDGTTRTAISGSDAERSSSRRRHALSTCGRRAGVARAQARRSQQHAGTAPARGVGPGHRHKQQHARRLPSGRAPLSAASISRRHTRRASPRREAISEHHRPIWSTTPDGAKWGQRSASRVRRAGPTQRAWTPSKAGPRLVLRCVLRSTTLMLQAAGHRRAGASDPLAPPQSRVRGCCALGTSCGRPGT
jgi:hypothetical protein